MRNLGLDSQTGTAAATKTLTAVEIESTVGYGMMLTLTVATASVKTFGIADVDIDTETFTVTAHGYATGLKVALTTDGTLPAGLSATDYYVIKVDDDNIQLATSQANALLGTAVPVTTVGVGTQTLTPAALAGGSYKLQVSMDGVNYMDLAAATAVTVSVTTLIEKVHPMYKDVRVVFTATAGQIGYTVQTLKRG